MTTSFTETTVRSFEFVRWEADADYSREEITILAGSGSDRVLTAGMVLGRVRGAIAAPVAFTAANAGRNNTGNGTFAATPTAKAGLMEGTYKLVIVEPGTDVGRFVIFDPNGVLIGNGTVATAYDGPHLAFTLQDGSTDFVAGDGFLITVAAGTKYIQHHQDGTTGNEIAAAILAYDKTAPNGVDVKATAFVRNCVVKSASLVWQSDIEAGEKTTALAQLAALGIIAR